MLSRRYLRIKVLQALYAFFQSGNLNLESGEKHLLKSINGIYDLHIYMLSFLIEIIDFRIKRIEDGRNKYFPTEEDLNPDVRLIQNRFINQIRKNKNFITRSDALKINWADEHNIVLKIYNELIKSERYQEYINSENDNYQLDKEFISDLLLENLAVSDHLQQFFSDKNIFWSDGDYELAVFLSYKLISSYKESWVSERRLPGPYKVDGDMESDDRRFLTDLFRKTIIHSEDNESLIESKAKNWELERIAVMDMIILKMALTEILEFESIPVKVSMNEYIEISKYYSSSKSKIFINGVLDKLIAQFKEDGKLHKTGRGLLE